MRSSAALTIEACQNVDIAGQDSAAIHRQRTTRRLLLRIHCFYAATPVDCSGKSNAGSQTKSLARPQEDTMLTGIQARRKAFMEKHKGKGDEDLHAS